MRETYRKRNHNQKGQFTRPEMTRYLKDHRVFAEFVKTIEDTTGLFSRLCNPDLDRFDKRTRNIEYSFHFILIVCALTSSLAISSANAFGSAFIEPCALENVSFLAHETTSRVIDYQAINNAISKMDDLSWIEGIAQDICEQMHRSGRYKKYRKWYGVVVVIDATDYAFFRSPHCDHDLTATFHKGTNEEKTYYFHKALVARLFFTKTISFPIGIEFIENQEPNPNKQDCENKAAIRLMKRLKERFPLMTFIICGDSLYANRTFIRLCTEYHWNYLFTLKAGSQPSLCAEFDSMVQHDLARHAKIRYDSETGTVYWANDMGAIVNSSLLMNILCYQTKMPVTKGNKKARGIQNAIIRRKDINQNMPELSKDQSEYNLDERPLGKNSRTQIEKASAKEERSNRGKENLSQINAELATAVSDGQISNENVKVGDTIEVSFMYITNLRISKETVGDLLVRGRGRWMIEETFLREKLGAQRLEHLRSMNPTAMKFYFWMEAIGDSCMQIYLDSSRALEVAGSEKRVYEMLKESFETSSLKDNYDTGRKCYWHYGDERNVYPTVEILPDDEPEGTDQPQVRKNGASRKNAYTGTQEAGKRHPENRSGNTREGNAEAGKDSMPCEQPSVKAANEKSDEAAVRPQDGGSALEISQRDMPVAMSEERAVLGQPGMKDMTCSKTATIGSMKKEELSVYDISGVSAAKQEADVSEGKEKPIDASWTVNKMVKAGGTDAKGSMVSETVGQVPPGIDQVAEGSGGKEGPAISGQRPGKRITAGRNADKEQREPGNVDKAPTAAWQTADEADIKARSTISAQKATQVATTDGAVNERTGSGTGGRAFRVSEDLKKGLLFNGKARILSAERQLSARAPCRAA